MTNKEHLAELSPQDWYSRVDWLFHRYSKWYTDSYVAILDWLEREYEPVKPLLPNVPDYMYKYCPVCYSPLFNHEKKCCLCGTDIDWGSED